MPISVYQDTPTKGEVRIVATGRKGTITLTIEIEEEDEQDGGFPVIDIAFTGNGMMYTVNADHQDPEWYVPQNKQLCVTLKG